MLHPAHVLLSALFVLAFACSYAKQKFESDRRKAFEMAQNLERFKVFR
jgi:hypothetical protein